MANPELQVDQKIRKLHERMDRLEQALLRLTEVGLGEKNEHVEEIKAILNGPETASEGSTPAA